MTLLRSVHIDVTELSPDARSTVLSLVGSLTTIPALRHLDVRVDEDVIGAVFLFDSVDELKRYEGHPSHIACGQRLREFGLAPSRFDWDLPLRAADEGNPR